MPEKMGGVPVLISPADTEPYRNPLSTRGLLHPALIRDLTIEYRVTVELFPSLLPFRYSLFKKRINTLTCVVR